MINLKDLPATVAGSVSREFLQWLMQARARVNNKLEVIAGIANNVPVLTADGGLEDSGKEQPGGEFVGDTDTQILTNKTLVTPTIASFVNAVHNHKNNAGGGLLDEDALAMTDVTTNNVGTTKHGFCPKAPNETTKFLRGDGTWAVPTDAAKTIRLPYTWVIEASEALAVETLPGMYVKLPTGQTGKLALARHKIYGGTSATVSVLINAVGATGFTAISVTTAAADTDPTDVTLADNDFIQPDITAITGTPLGLSFTIFIDYII